MAILLIKRPLIKKPVSFSRPDLTHPLLKNANWWMPFIGSLFDVYKGFGANPDDQREERWEASPYGAGLRFENVGDRTQYDLASHENFWTDEFSLYVELYSYGYGNDGRILEINTATNGSFRAWNDDGLPGIRFSVSPVIGQTETSAVFWTIPGYNPVGAYQQWLFTQRNGQGSRVCYRQNHGQIQSITDPGYVGTVDSPDVIFNIGNRRSTRNRGADHTYLQIRNYGRAIFDDAEVEYIFDNPWGMFERRIWIPVEAGPPGPVQLNIDDLRHARQVDQVDVIELITLIPIDIDDLRHARAVDDVPALGVSVNLFLAGLRHARFVDELAIIASVDLGVDGLTHGRRTDVVDVQELVGVVINIDDARHGRPVDALLLNVDQPILIDGLRHARPVDDAGVQLLMGDQTGIGATASAWVLDAGQSLNNASSIDFGYHVLEGVFDGNQSVLGVDGSRVTGPAGLRELTVLTLGADVDGQRRMQGEIAELRIYAGALSQTDRDRITQELATKWITG